MAHHPFSCFSNFITNAFSFENFIPFDLVNLTRLMTEDWVTLYDFTNFVSARN